MNPESSQLWNRLQENGIVDAPMPIDSVPNTPWFTKIITVFGAWFAALFLSIFLGMASQIFSEPLIGFFTGAGILFVCAKLFKKNGKSEFLTHFILPLSLIGQLCVAAGIAFSDFTLSLAVVSLPLLCIQVVLIKVMDNGIHRIWSTLMASLCFGIFLLDLEIFFLFIPILFAGCSFILLNMLRWVHAHHTIAPIGYGMVFSLLGGIAYFYLNFADTLESTPQLSEACTGILFLGLTVLLLQRHKEKASPIIAACCILISLGVSVLSYHAIGASSACALVLLGFANRNRVVMVTGFITMLICISVYYYTLSITLLEKSFILAVISGILLFVQSVLKRNLSAKEKSHAS